MLQACEVVKPLKSNLCKKQLKIVKDSINNLCKKQLKIVKVMKSNLKEILSSLKNFVKIL